MNAFSLYFCCFSLVLTVLWFSCETLIELLEVTPLLIFLYFGVGCDCFEALDLCSLHHMELLSFSVRTLCDTIPVALVARLVSVQIKCLRSLHISWVFHQNFQQCAFWKRLQHTILHHTIPDCELQMMKQKGTEAWIVSRRADSSGPRRDLTVGCWILTACCIH